MYRRHSDFVGTHKKRKPERCSWNSSFTNATKTVGLKRIFVWQETLLHVKKRVEKNMERNEMPKIKNVTEYCSNERKMKLFKIHDENFRCICQPDMCNVQMEIQLLA